MSKLAAFLGSVFGGLFSFLATYFGKKVAFGLTISATMLAVTVAFYTAIKLLVTGLVSEVSNQWLLMGFYIIWPSNAEGCIAACLSADLLAFVYRYQVDTIKAVAASG